MTINHCPLVGVVKFILLFLLLLVVMHHVNVKSFAAYIFLIGGM